MDRFGQEVPIPKEFIYAGDSTSGAIFDLARTVVRRAERAVARLHFEGEVKYPHPLIYLNRLSSLCFLFTLVEDQEKGSTYTAPIKDSEK